MIHKKLLIGVASRLGGRLVCSTEGLIFQYIPTFTFVYVLFQLKEEKKRQSRKVTAWPQPHFSPYPPSNFQNLMAASSPPSSDPLQPLKSDSTAATAPGGGGAAALHSCLSCPAARSPQGPPLLGGGKLPQGLGEQAKRLGFLLNAWKEQLNTRLERVWDFKKSLLGNMQLLLEVSDVNESSGYFPAWGAPALWSPHSFQQ